MAKCLRTEMPRSTLIHESGVAVDDEVFKSSTTPRLSMSWSSSLIRIQTVYHTSPLLLSQEKIPSHHGRPSLLLLVIHPIQTAHHAAYLSPRSRSLHQGCLG